MKTIIIKLPCVDSKMSSRKKTIKTVKIEPTVISKSVFKSKAIKTEDESDASKINIAIKEAAAQKAERELLEQELEKPSSARNPALMRKFGTSNLSGTIDNYPDLDKGGKFHITITIQDDPNVPIEHRPTPWSITIVLQHQGNEFSFVFPISRAVAIPSAAYKLDNYDVYLDENHNVLVSLTEKYTIYEALLDYKSGDETYLLDRLDLFKDLGILGENGKLDFRVRGFGFLVSYKRLKTIASVNKATAVSVPKKTKQSNLIEVVVEDNVQFIGNRTAGEKVLKALKETKQYNILGVPLNDHSIEKVYIYQILTSLRFTNPTIVLDYTEGGEIFALAIAGPTAAKEFLGKSSDQKVTTAEFEAKITQRNTMVFDEYKAFVLDAGLGKE